MDFDYHILETFIYIPEHRKSFLAFDRVYIGGDGNIIVKYRAPFDEQIIVDKLEYDNMVFAKKRDISLNKIL